MNFCYVFAVIDFAVIDYLQLIDEKVQSEQKIKDRKSMTEKFMNFQNMFWNIDLLYPY